MNMHFDVYQNVRINSIATNTNYVFRLNSIYDPDYSFGGNQPLFYTQIATLYSYYKVLTAQVSLEIANNSSAADTQYAISPSVFVPISTITIPTFAQHPLATSGVVTRINSNAQLVKIKKKKISMASLFNQQITEDNFGAPMNTNPLNQAYLNMAFSNTITGMGNIDLNIIVKIRYFTHCYGLVNVVAS